MHIVREIKKFHPFTVKNALWLVGYRWAKPNRSPNNIETMLTGIPRHHLLLVLKFCKEAPA